MEEPRLEPSDFTLGQGLFSWNYYFLFHLIIICRLYLDRQPHRLRLQVEHQYHATQRCDRPQRGRQCCHAATHAPGNPHTPGHCSLFQPHCLLQVPRVQISCHPPTTTVFCCYCYGGTGASSALTGNSLREEAVLSSPWMQGSEH